MARMIRTNVGPYRVTVTRQPIADLMLDGHHVWSVVRFNHALQWGWERGQTDALGTALAAAAALNRSGT